MNSQDIPAIGLVQQAQTGDREAFAALYRQHALTVLRTAYLILGDAGRAEEVTQDVFVRVYRHLDTYTSQRGTFEAWLYRITVNLCLTARRRRILSYLSLERNEAWHELSAITPTPLELVLQSEEQWHIWRAVQKLPLKLRAAVVLRYYHDLNYEEVAQVIGCPVGTIRSRLHSAHEQLRGKLEE